MPGYWKVDMDSLLEDVNEFLDLPSEAFTQENFAETIEFLDDICMKLGAFESLITANISNLKIMGGKVVKKLKSHVEGNGQNWEELIKKDMPFLDMREADIWMRMAGRQDAYKWALVGPPRLLALIDASEGIHSDDPIWQFTEETDMHELGNVLELQDLLNFHEQLNLAISFRKITAAGIIVEKNSVKVYLEHGHKVDATCIKTLKKIKKEKKNPDAYLRDPKAFTKGIPKAA